MWKMLTTALALVLTTTVTRAQHTPDTAIVENGRGLFAAYCASCHGANGEGAIGPKLAGVVVQAFPNPNDEATFVEHGRGIMPAFAGSLSAAQIRAVVNYTRTELGK